MDHPRIHSFHATFGVSVRFPKPVFRFVETEEYANALLRGDVWISTLSACRAYEATGRGDKGEGTLDYHIKHAQGNGHEAGFRTIAGRAGIKVSQASGVTLSNISYRSHLADAFVLCTTLEYSPETLSSTFGNHCIKIIDSAQFFHLITQRLKSQTRLREALLGPVQYSPREYTGLEDPPGPLGFVKPPDMFEHQKEFRMLWVPFDQSALKPFLLSAPEIVPLVRRA